jgi:hypothetical protein
MHAARLSLLALAMACALALGGCSTSRLFLVLAGDANSNQGRPLQVLIRSVPIDTYRAEPYAALARLVLSPDKSVLRMLTLYPQGPFRRCLSLTAPDKVPLALYFLYTSPVGSWKMLLPTPPPVYLRIPLGRDGVDVERVREIGLWR